MPFFLTPFRPRLVSCRTVLAEYTPQNTHISTSGRSTKLIHGGIRYLEAAFKNLDIESYRLVEEALEERAYMLQVTSQAP